MRSTILLRALLASLSMSVPALAQTDRSAMPSPSATPPPAATVTPTTPPATTDAPAGAAGATDDLGPDPTAPQAGQRFPGDPYEKLNRKIWGVNMGVDKVVLRPASSVYRHVTPKPLRHGLSRVLSNLSEPWSLVNNLLQGHPDRAARNLGRFLVNMTIGVGGLADHASEFGVRPANEDFGQTLAVWGVKSSAYLVLPLLGPSTVRDGVGSVVAIYADPYRICLRSCVDLSSWTKIGITAFTAVSARADATEAGADSFLDSSLDSYAAARSAYLQQRANDIANDDGGAGGGDMAGAASAPPADATDASAPASGPDASAPTAPPQPDTGGVETPDADPSPAPPPPQPR